MNVEAQGRGPHSGCDALPFGGPATARASFAASCPHTVARGQLAGEQLAAGVVERVLAAAHDVPTAGLGELWERGLLPDDGTGKTFSDHVQRARARAGADTGGEGRAALDLLPHHDAWENEEDSL